MGNIKIIHIFVRLKSETPRVTIQPSAWPGANVAIIQLYLLHPLVLTKSCPTLCKPVDCSPPAPLSTGFSWQEHWSGFPFPPPGDQPEPGIKPMSLVSPALQAEALLLSHQGSPHFNIHGQMT